MNGYWKKLDSRGIFYQPLKDTLYGSQHPVTPVLYITQSRVHHVVFGYSVAIFVTRPEVTTLEGHYPRDWTTSGQRKSERPRSSWLDNVTAWLDLPVESVLLGAAGRSEWKRRTVKLRWAVTPVNFYIEHRAVKFACTMGFSDIVSPSCHAFAGGLS